MWVLPALFLSIALGYPLVSVLQRSFADIQSIDLSPQLGIAASAALQAFISMTGALLIGIPIAGVLATYRFRGRAFVQAIVTVPFVLPTVVIALAFRELLGTTLNS